MNSFYCICGLYDTLHNVDGKEYAWGTQQFLGVNSHRIWIYEDVPTERTLKFNTKEEAEAYIDKYDIRNGGGINVFLHFVVEVTEFVEEVTNN